jgi:uncharacterized repeat protein (TIGR01451 family)
MEVIGSAYSIFVLDGKTGSLLWKVASGHDRSQPSASDVGRTWAGVVVADVDNDGQPEIVTAHSGGVVSVLDHNGYFKPGWPQNPVSEEFRSLAVADLDGVGMMEIAVGRAKLAAPTLADIDGDGNLDVELNTADSGLVAYSLPGTVGATILWGTGRGSYQRNGSLPSSLARSGFSIDPPSPTPGSKVTVTIKLTNPGAPLVNVTATDTLPTELTYLGNAQVSCGAFNAVGNTLTWTGAVPMNVPVIVTFQVELSSTLSGRPMISNSLTISYGRGQSLTRQAAVIVNGLNHYLPLAMH